MSIDVAALRKLQGILEPLVAAIPVFIELDARREDLERGLRILESELQKKQAEQERAMEVANAALLALQKQRDEVVAQLQETAAAHAVEQQAHQRKLDAATEQSRARLADLQKQTATAQEQLRLTKAEAAAAADSAKKAISAQLEAAKQELLAVEQQRKKHEAALAELRAKLGV